MVGHTGVGYRWIDSLKQHAEAKVSDEMFKAAKYRFPDGEKQVWKCLCRVCLTCPVGNVPVTKEGYLYRTIFEEHYPQPSAAACVPGGEFSPASSVVDDIFHTLL